MTNQTIGTIIGGFLPAVIFGVGALFTKLSQRNGISIKYFALFIAIGTLCAAVIALFSMKDNAIHPKSAIYAVLLGSSWLVGITLMGVGISKYQASLSVISPLAALNSFITVILSLIVFHEWRVTDVKKLLLGTLLILIGGILVSQAPNKKSVEEPEITASDTP